jgi:hypothetical protein
MTGSDWLALISAATCSAALGLRANMLKPTFSSWFAAPTIVWLPLMLSSIVMASVALAILRGAHMSGLVAVAFAAQAVASVSLLWNLARQSQPRHGGPHP